MPDKETPYTLEERHLFAFTVTPMNRSSGVFPIDMLRYDSAWPADETASRRIRDTLNGTSYSSEMEIQLIRAGRNAQGPTLARWRSYGWDVIDVSPA